MFLTRILQGMVPTLYRDVFGYAIYFATYEYLKRQFNGEAAASSGHGGGGDLIGVLAAGGLAGVAYHALTQYVACKNNHISLVHWMLSRALYRHKPL